MFKIEAHQRMLKAAGEDHQWVKKVEEKQEQKPQNQPDFPEDFFKGQPNTIAQGLKSKSKDYQQAMSRLSFYINRAGKNLTSQDKQRLDQAKDALARLYGRDKPESKDENKH